MFQNIYRALQLLLLKMCLLVGAEIRVRETFSAIVEPVNSDKGWEVVTERTNPAGFKEERREVFDIVIGATGTRTMLEGFQRKSLDAKMAIAIRVSTTAWK